MIWPFGPRPRSDPSPKPDMVLKQMLSDAGWQGGFLKPGGASAGVNWQSFATSCCRWKLKWPVDASRVHSAVVLENETLSQAAPADWSPPTENEESFVPTPLSLFAYWNPRLQLPVVR